jgi:aspartate/methionine/tyrosine aminotransferase
MSERFNALEGMSCVPADGAMYLLPKIDMPKRAVEEAEKRGKKADVMYTLDMLGESISSSISIPFGRRRYSDGPRPKRRGDRSKRKDQRREK